MIIGSLVFALIHSFDLSTTEAKLNAVFAFITSLWLYVVRFNPLNPRPLPATLFYGPYRA
jgi:hypothetical protein